MKTWQIFVLGMLALAAGFLLPLYERLLAGISAVIVLGAVVYGFCLRPGKEVFLVRTTFKAPRLNHFTIEHDQIAVKVVLARLWLLFLPTFIAVGFLVATAAEGTTWSFQPVRPASNRLGLSDRSLRFSRASFLCCRDNLRLDQ